MISKRHKKVYSIVTVVLLILIAFFSYDIMFGKSKEIKVAEKFMKRLESIYAINTDQKVSDMDFKIMDVKGNIDKNVGHTIITDKYGVNLDQANRVVGFSKKETKHGKNVNVTEAEAITIAKKFVSEITDESLEYKELKLVEGQDLPYYNVCFSKKQEEYIFFDKEVVLQIDKYTGELDGYSNAFLNGTEVFVSDINIDEDSAKQSLKSYLDKLSTEIEECKLDGIGYSTINENKYILSYVFDVKSKANDGTVKKAKFRIDASNGEVLNSTK